MSAATSLAISKIHIPLLDEGTIVSRPTSGVALGNNEYLVLATVDYNPNLETWEFPPGTIVICIEEESEVGNILLAQRAR